MALDGPLEARANATHWARLLDLALPALDFASPPEVANIAE